MLYGDVINKLYLESNDTNDESFSYILKGLTDQYNFKSMTYKKNKLDIKSVECILKLISRHVPQNLDELRIVNCAISTKAMTLLLDNLPGTNLRKLSLVKVGIKGALFDNVLKLIHGSRNVIELDISWNRISSVELR